MLPARILGARTTIGGIPLAGAAPWQQQPTRAPQHVHADPQAAEVLEAAPHHHDAAPREAVGRVSRQGGPEGGKVLRDPLRKEGRPGPSAPAQRVRCQGAARAQGAAGPTARASHAQPHPAWPRPAQPRLISSQPRRCLPLPTCTSLLGSWMPSRTKSRRPSRSAPARQAGAQHQRPCPGPAAAAATARPARRPATQRHARCQAAAAAGAAKSPCKAQRLQGCTQGPPRAGRGSQALR
jgi:hypothetical protein